MKRVKSSLDTFSSPPPKKMRGATNLARNNSTPSPAKATPTSPPQGFGSIESFCFFNLSKTKKKLGSTPQGKNLIPLQQFEGDSHQYLRTEIKGELLTVRGDTNLSSPLKTQAEARTLVVLAQMQDLKNRADNDYKKALSGQMGTTHFLATKRKITECIKDLKRCYALQDVDKNKFLTSLNDNIDLGKFYNPLQLLPLYQGISYPVAEAEKVERFLNPLKQEDLDSKPKKIFFGENSTTHFTSLLDNNLTLINADSNASTDKNVMK